MSKKPNKSIVRNVSYFECGCGQRIEIKVILTYRPGQPIWEYTMQKFQDFSATRILREINFDHIESPQLPF